MIPVFLPGRAGSFPRSPHQGLLICLKESSLIAQPGTLSSWVDVLRPETPTAPDAHAPRSTPRFAVMDLAGQRSARPSAEISEHLSHVIGGFPGLLLPTLPLIYGVFLKSSCPHTAASHPSPRLVHGSHFWHHGTLLTIKDSSGLLES